jgi:hypothetical protein
MRRDSGDSVAEIPIANDNRRYHSLIRSIWTGRVVEWRARHPLGKQPHRKGDEDRSGEIPRKDATKEY